MSTSVISFNVVYSPEAAAQAAQAFREYRFKRYGLLMIGASIINALGLFGALWLGAQPGTPSLLFVTGLVVLGPAWLLYQHYLWPTLHVSRLLRSLPSPGRVSLTSESLSIETRKQDAVFQWSSIKGVVETPATFLVVLYPFMFLFIPKVGIPVEAHDALRSKVA